MLDALLCDSYVKYEHPLNEKIRIFLRIEHIWHDLEYSIKQENDASCIIGLLNILSLLEINERFELRSEAIKYLDKLLVKWELIYEIIIVNFVFNSTWCACNNT